MLVDNKVPFFRRETAPEISTEFLPNFPFAKKQTPTYLHSCFHLKVIVSNRRWIFLLNIFFLPVTIRFWKRGKFENAFGSFLWEFREDISLVKDIFPLADDCRVDSHRRWSFRPKTEGKIMTEANIQLNEVDSPGTTFSVVLAFAV